LLLKGDICNGYKILGWSCIWGSFATVFMLAYFRPPQVDGQYVILRVIASILAGAAGLFLSGEVFTQFSGEMSNGLKLTVSATGAIGLFVLVWLTFPNEPTKQHLPEIWKFSLPNSITFHKAAEVIQKVNNASLTIEGFTPEEERIVLTSLGIHEPTQANAFKRLADMVPPNSLPPYEVIQTGLHFKLIAKRS